MEAKDQIMLNLKNENNYLRGENEFLKVELMKFTGGGNFTSHIPVFSNSINTKNSYMEKDRNVYLPPINNNTKQDLKAENSLKSEIISRKSNSSPKKHVDINSKSGIHEKLKNNLYNNFNNDSSNNILSENENLKSVCAQYEKQNYGLLQDNLKLKDKIYNLENAFMSGNITNNSKNNFNNEFTNNTGEFEDFKNNSAV